MKLRLPAVLAFVGAATSFAGLAYSQTLEQALAAAYTRNPTLEAERASLRATDEGVSQALSNWRPKLSADGDVGTAAVRNNTATGTNRGQHRDPRSAGISLSQPLYRGGRTLAQTRQAENTVLGSRAALKSVEQGVLLDAVEAFMAVNRDQAVLNLNVGNEQVLRRQLEAARDRFQVGEITRTDVHQAEARLARATADRIQAEGNLAASRATYINVIGEPSNNPVTPQLPANLPTSLEAAIKEAESNNPTLAKAEYDELAARDKVDLVWGELLPSLNLSAEASRSFDSGGEHTRISSYSAKLSLDVPLYQSGSVYSRLREARQTVSKTLQKAIQARRNAVESSTRAWRALETARARVVSFRTQIRASETALEGVRREAEVGSRTVLDVLDAEQERLDASVNLVRAERDQIVAGYTLLEAVGALTAADLKLAVDFYDPTVHYQEVRNKWFGGRSSGDGGSMGGVGGK
ncbi:MAG: TolC family outer membrane protein [Rhodospirillales bacterium]|nr:TolC family outer membrane protein [Rhodospirillales bacterium]